MKSVRMSLAAATLAIGAAEAAGFRGATFGMRAIVGDSIGSFDL
jgi:hypothetical protein